MKAKHIVQVSSYYPPHLGGQENAVHDLAHQLAHVGNTVHVLTSAVGAKKGTTVEKKVCVKRLPGLVFGHAPIMPNFLLSLLRAAKSHSIVHLHIGQAFTPEMVWLASKLRRFKFIAQLHIDFEPSGPLGFLLPIYKKFILKRVLQSADAVITLNEKTLRTVRDTYGYTGRARIMNNGIDEAYFKLVRKRFAAEPPKTLQLLFVGRLSKQKNVPALIEGLAKTKRKTHLHVIGEGPEREAIEAAIAKCKIKNVTLHGRLPRKKVMQFYKECDALVMPSLYEAQPLVLLEAMAARIPIIGTNVIGVEEHIKKAGIIVPPTPYGIAQGIMQYDTQYAKLPKMVEQGYKQLEPLRWPQAIKEYEALYEKVLAY